MQAYTCSPLEMLRDQHAFFQIDVIDTLVVVFCWVWCEVKGQKSLRLLYPDVTSRFILLHWRDISGAMYLCQHMNFMCTWVVSMAASRWGLPTENSASLWFRWQNLQMQESPHEPSSDQKISLVVTTLIFYLTDFV